MRIEDLGKHFILCVFVIFCAKHFFTELSNWLWICRGHWDCTGLQGPFGPDGPRGFPVSQCFYISFVIKILIMLFAIMI